MPGSGDDGTDDVLLLVKLFSGISKVTIHHLDFTIQELKVSIFFLDDLLQDLDGLMDEFLVHIFTFVSLLFHVLDEGIIFFLFHFMIPKLLKGLHKLCVKGSFSVIITPTVICSE